MKEHEIVYKVQQAKANMHKAEEFILASMPFVRAQVSKYLNKPVFDNRDDETSIAMIAFHEAIQSYQKDKGAFFTYAAMLIRSRLIDYTRTETRHVSYVSLDEKISDDDETLHMDKLGHSDDHSDKILTQLATKKEIEELSEQMKTFGISLNDVAENCPKQHRSMESCKKILACAKENPELLEELVETKRLPLKKLCDKTGVERKTAERHRRYLVALLLIYTNGYEIIRSHLVHLNERGNS